MQPATNSVVYILNGWEPFLTHVATRSIKIPLLYLYILGSTDELEQDYRPSKMCS
jgi:hypothetical protein